MKKLRNIMYSLIAPICGLMFVAQISIFAGISPVDDAINMFCMFAIVAIIPANVAYNKGRNFAVWYVYATCLFPVTFVHSLCIRDNDKAKQEKGWVRCPYCGEYNKPEARACHYCYRELHLGDDQ